MFKGSPWKLFAVWLCFGVCVLAPDHESRGMPKTTEQRLPGEPPPPFAAKWGTTGAGDGQFNMPAKVAVAPSGDVYVADRNNHRIQKFDNSGVYLTQWGANGSGDGQFISPQGIDVDVSGNVYIADSGNHRVQKFDSTGTLLKMWGWGVDNGTAEFQTCTADCEAGISGSGDGQFNFLWDLTVDVDGNVYVADSFNHRIQKFDSEGNYLTQWGSNGTGPSQFDSPYGVSVDISGNVYVADSLNYRIKKFSSDGSFLTAWGTRGSGNGQFEMPIDIAFDASGKVYVIEYATNRIQKFEPNGTFLVKWGTYGTGDGQLAFPIGMDADSYGNLYVADTGNDRIQKFGPPFGLVFLAEWGTEGAGNGQFENPFGVAIGASDIVYVADTINHRIQKFDSTGVFLAKWGTNGSGDGELSSPYGVAVDASGNIYVADSYNHRIQKFSSSGTYLTKWGAYCDTGVAGQDGCDGQFAYPSGVAVDASNNVYVAEVNNSRIQKFDQNGTFLAKWGSEGAAERQFKWPQGVAVDASGNVYVPDSYNDRIQRFDSTGNFLSMWGWGVADGSPEYQVCTSSCLAGISGAGDGQFDNPYAVAFDGAGNVYVAGGANHRVQKFSSSGSFLTKWGQFGLSGDGNFWWPQGIAVDSLGDVYVSDSGNDRIQKFGRCSYSAVPTSALVGFTGGADSLGVDAIVEACGWTVTSDRPWIQVTSGGAGIGDGTVEFSVDPNPLYVSRAGTITIADRSTGGPGTTFSVTQDPISCTYSILPTEVSFTEAGGTGSVNVTTLAGCAWTAVSNNSWIGVSILGGDPGHGSGSAAYAVQPNPSISPRSGTVTIAGHTFTVHQAGAPCTYSILPTEESFTGSGGTAAVEVTALAGCSWAAASDDPWITVTSGTPGNGPGTVEYTVAANDGSAARVGRMIIAGKSFTVNQDPQVPVAPTDLAGEVLSSTKLKLTWTDNADNETELRVERKIGAAGTFAQIVTLPPDSTECTDSGLARRTEYVYRVMACNSAGCSAFSSEVTLSTPALGIFIGDDIQQKPQPRRR
jgi:hypothetical protein